MNYEDLPRLARHMADRDYTADQIAYAMEKPLKHLDVWQEVLTNDEFAALARSIGGNA